MRHPTDTLYWVDEAIQSLGYIKPEAAKTLARLIDTHKNEAAKAIATRHRKDGPQVSTDEKKALGIRANAFLSIAAKAELTEKGLDCPLVAHEQTILRASLAASRAASISQEQAFGVEQWRFCGTGVDNCPGCKRLDDKVISIDEAVPTGPHDCARDACAAAYSPSIDFLKDLGAKTPRTGRTAHSARPWWKFW
jgi:hypothetical protein